MRRLTWTWCALVPLTALMACGSDDKDSSGEGMGGAAVMLGGATGDSGAATTGGGGTAGASMAQGGVKNSGGAKATGGAPSEGGAEASGGEKASGGAPPAAGAAGMGATGTQPPGAICSNDTNCSQSQGKAACCNSTCMLGGCATTTFLPCNSKADCAVYGGGKICCEATTSSETMRFCTKQSACMGRVLP